MKILITFILFAFALGAEAKIDYGCHPLESSFDNSVEGAVVATENGTTTLTYYTTSDTWGAVDEWKESALFSKTNAIISVESSSANLTIDLKKLVGDMQGDFSGILQVPSKNINVEMVCNEGEF